MTTRNPDPAPPRELLLTEEHIPACLALSAEANWNQTEADWRMLLRLGQGFGLQTADGQLVATALALPFAGPFAWISMVLVTPAWQRRGLASRLMRRAIQAIEAEGRIPMLDATPAGRAVYGALGFTDGWGFSRWSGTAPGAQATRLDPPALAGTLLRPIEESDWPRLLALDGPVFGADRAPLLRALWQRLPRAACLLEQEGELLGFLLGREGRHATQLGPLIARDAASAVRLLHAGLRAVQGPVYVDALDRQPEIPRLLTQAGFQIQRPFTRMARAVSLPEAEQPDRYFAVAGPELA